MSTTKPKGGEARRRILILDDHPMTREGLHALLGREPDLAICGEASNVAQAQALVKTLKPDLVIADVTLPDKSGLEFVREVKSFYPKLPVLVVSMHDESIYAERLLQAGARGYLMKSEGGEKLLEAVRQVLSGGVYVSKKVYDFMLELAANRRPRGAHAAINGLTEREFDVFQLMGQGLGTQAIANKLHLSGKTVETHRSNLRRKLKQETSSQLACYAVRWAAAQKAI